MEVSVSVIIAAYNVERYIERAVRSALEQDGVTLEVIIVDDCSTDKTFEIAKAIGDARIKCIRQPNNGGPGAARNAGIAAATGQWIAILDGDDAFAKGRLEHCIQRARDANAQIVVDNLSVFQEAGGATFPMFPPARFSGLRRLTLADFIAGNQSFMGGYALGYLKPVFLASFLHENNLHYRTDIRIGEDYLLLAKALACGAICSVSPQQGYLYTARAGSTSHRLVPEDVLLIASCDRSFLAEHTLDAAAAKAQKWREFHLKEAYAFTLLVQALKQRQTIGALKAAGMAPSALRHLWRPAWVRIRRAMLLVS